MIPPYKVGVGLDHYAYFFFNVSKQVMDADDNELSEAGCVERKLETLELTRRRIIVR
jgi:hypothetical protein